MGFLSSNSFMSAGFTSFSNFSRRRTLPLGRFSAFLAGAASIFFSLASLSAICFSSHGFRFNGFVRSSIFSFEYRVSNFENRKLLVHRGAAMFADAHLAVALRLVSDARGLAARGANQLHVGDVDPAFLFRDTALGLALLGLHGLLHHHDVLDQDLPFIRENAQNAPLLAF